MRASHGPKSNHRIFNNAVIAIQRTFRGYLGRKQYLKAVLDKERGRLRAKAKKAIPSRPKPIPAKPIQNELYDSLDRAPRALGELGEELEEQEPVLYMKVPKQAVVRPQEVKAHYFHASGSGLRLSGGLQRLDQSTDSLAGAGAQGRPDHQKDSLDDQQDEDERYGLDVIDEGDETLGTLRSGSGAVRPPAVRQSHGTAFNPVTVAHGHGHAQGHGQGYGAQGYGKSKQLPMVSDEEDLRDSLDMEEEDAPVVKVKKQMSTGMMMASMSKSSQSTGPMRSSKEVPASVPVPVPVTVPVAAVPVSNIPRLKPAAAAPTAVEKIKQLYDQQAASFFPQYAAAAEVVPARRGPLDAPPVQETPRQQAQPQAQPQPQPVKKAVAMVFDMSEDAGSRPGQQVQVPSSSSSVASAQQGPVKRREQPQEPRQDVRRPEQRQPEPRQYEQRPEPREPRVEPRPEPRPDPRPEPRMVPKPDPRPDPRSEPRPDPRQPDPREHRAAPARPQPQQQQQQAQVLTNTGRQSEELERKLLQELAQLDKKAAKLGLNHASPAAVPSAQSAPAAAAPVAVPAAAPRRQVDEKKKEKLAFGPAAKDVRGKASEVKEAPVEAPKAKAQPKAAPIAVEIVQEWKAAVQQAPSPTRMPLVSDGYLSGFQKKQRSKSACRKPSSDQSDAVSDGPRGARALLFNRNAPPLPMDYVETVSLPPIVKEKGAEAAVPYKHPMEHVSRRVMGSRHSTRSAPSNY